MKSQYYILGIFFLTLIFMSGCLTNEKSENKLKNISSDSEISELSGDLHKVVIYFFWGEGCPHCSVQKPYLDEWELKYSDNIEIKMFETWKNKDNNDFFQEIASVYGIQIRGVPTTFIGEKHWNGFASSMAEEMEDYILFCIQNNCESPLNEINISE